jgi:hypothetical protein
MITRVYFVKAQQDNPKGGVAHSFRTVEYKSLFRPKMWEVINNALNKMTTETGLPFDGWCVDSFSKVV